MSRNSFADATSGSKIDFIRRQLPDRQKRKSPQFLTLKSDGHGRRSRDSLTRW